MLIHSFPHSFPPQHPCVCQDAPPGSERCSQQLGGTGWLSGGGTESLLSGGGPRPAWQPWAPFCRWTTAGTVPTTLPVCPH